MVFGGSLNKDGSNYLRVLKEAERAVKFLEELKKEISHSEREKLEDTIEIITDYINKLSENED
ncbi:MAG: hypothetical protein ACOC44_11895 [Promethearchaeia archaeon]